jgi:hypothetical protein
LLGLLACSPHKGPGQSASSSNAPAPQHETAPSSAAEYADLRKLIATVTREERVRVATAYDELWGAYAAAAPEPQVLFEVPARECCPSPDEACAARHLEFAGLCYENPTRELWGLGPLAIDDDGKFWIHDPVVSRAIAFDREGRLVAAIRTIPDPERADSLVVTPAELWLDSFSPGDDPYASRLLRIDRATHRNLGDYYLKDAVGKEAQGSGWTMPGNASRIVRWSGDFSWNIVDVSFMDATRMRISAPHPLHARGHRYWLDCDLERKSPATLVIDDHALPAPGCIQVEYVGPEGDSVGGIPFYHLDVHGNVLAVASRVQRKFDILTSGRDTAVGPDGNAYQYIPRKHSVQFVQLPWFTK